jgi:hypothetical protein
VHTSDITIPNIFFILEHDSIWKVSRGAVVKLLPCDHDEVMGSSPKNSLLQKYKERLHI